VSFAVGLLARQRLRKTNVPHVTEARAPMLLVGVIGSHRLTARLNFIIRPLSSSSSSSSGGGRSSFYYQCSPTMSWFI